MNKGKVRRTGSQWGLVTRQQLEQARIPETSLDRLTAPGGALERVARGVYRLVGAPTAEHQELRAAWLQLAPNVPAWERTREQGVVSHRSAAALYGIGHLPADLHEFTVQDRKQTRRQDVRLHRRALDNSEWTHLCGLPVTRPARIASDLLYDKEVPVAVARVVTDSLRLMLDYPSTFARSLTPHANRFGLRRNDGVALLRWLLDLVSDENAPRWVRQAGDSAVRDGFDSAPAPSLSRTEAPTT
jgi:hypothetical protein